MVKGWKGYKVVNYSEWANLPDIFTSLAEAKEARERWEYKVGSVIEQIGTKMRRAKVIVRQMKDYMQKIRKFNKMYELEVNDKPTNLGYDRFKKLQDILQEEMDEGVDIACRFGDADDIDIMVDMADWLCDIMVYCSTFATTWGIDVEQVMNIIMESNFSKLDRDGNVIKDERGKVLKGEDYWKPEPKIKELFEKQQFYPVYRV